MTVPDYGHYVFLGSTTDGGMIYIAVSLLLPSLAAQGETPQEAESELREIVDRYVRNRLEYSLPLPDNPFPNDAKITGIEVKVDLHGESEPRTLIKWIRSD